ncbi:MAG: PLP-dependent lyase/thiolase [Candidatus Eisenbacteria bacterium]
MNTGPLRTASRLECAACGAAPDPEDPFPFCCPRAASGDDADHVLARRLDLARVRFADPGAVHPFRRHRELLHAWHRARTGGMSDAAFGDLVGELDHEIAAVDGHGFAVTPFVRQPSLAARLGMDAGAVWTKDETRNVAGSHKARHLFGLALHLEVAERIGLVSRAETDRRGLAIASCGNAALAAGVIARATRRPLTAFIPVDADPRVVDRLRGLKTRIEVCPRRAGIAGDPCLHAFHEAVASGSLPFCVQGNENGLTVEGGHTLVWEMAETLSGAGERLDRLFVQVGGGALASACAAALAESHALGLAIGAPRIHAVQTTGGFPLRRAYERVRADALARLGVTSVPDDADAVLAARLAAPTAREAVRAAWGHARAHRSRYMWPWETTPHSIAHGILDDETYDWAAVVEAMLVTGGWPVTVEEDDLREACALGVEACAVPVDATGAAGLAGVLALRRTGDLRPEEHVALLFTGIDRATTAEWDVS